MYKRILIDSDWHIYIYIWYERQSTRPLLLDANAKVVLM
uniref:Uncharacterized protein n=1 Tax=Rhizophora mucronata TaxID=61149 RepID=A0A2P2NMD2_RHIMU